jgi:hypothetical protein
MRRGHSDSRDLQANGWNLDRATLSLSFALSPLRQYHITALLKLFLYFDSAGERSAPALFVLDSNYRLTRINGRLIVPSSKHSGIEVAYRYAMTIALLAARTMYVLVLDVHVSCGCT